MTSIGGEIAIDCKVTLVTVRVADARKEPRAAVIAATPGVRVVTSPFESTTATDGAEEVQET